MSLCGRERNYIRCDDLPVVYTQVIQPEQSGDQQLLSYGGAGDECTILFEPQKICMLPWTGRIYHPAEGLPGDIGLIKSNLAIEWSTFFEFSGTDEFQEKPPTHFNWQGEKYKLTNELLDSATAHRLTYEE